MKKAFTFLVLFLNYTHIFSQIAYSENFGNGGTSTSTTAISTYQVGTAPNTFQQTSPITYSGIGAVVGPNCTIANYSPSTFGTSYTGASGGGFIVLSSSANSPGNRYITIDGINTSNFTAPILKLGVNISAYQANQLQLEYWDSSNSYWYPISISQPIGLGWRICTSGILPSSYPLKLRITNRFTESSSLLFTRIFLDDLKITYTSLGLNENILNDLNIYPNPAKDKFTIDIGNELNSNYPIKINNLLGQEVYSNIIDKPKFEVTKIWQGKGLFFVKIYDDNNNLIITKKIILQ
jgi:hypothetical protein